MNRYYNIIVNKKIYLNKGGKPKMLQNLRKKLKDNKGFSLVELIVVIAIMVILIALLVPQVTGQISKARSAADDSNAKSVYTAVNTYLGEIQAAGYVIDSDMTIVPGTSEDIGDETYAIDDYIPEGTLKGDATYSVEVTDKGKTIKVTYTNEAGSEVTYPKEDE